MVLTISTDTGHRVGMSVHSRPLDHDTRKDLTSFRFLH